MRLPSGVDSAAMTAAEFRIARERLGVSGEWLAAELGVTDRTVRRWEAGTAPIAAITAGQVRKMESATDRFVAQVTAELLADDPPRWLITYPSDAAYRAEWPELSWPASWHRAAMGRVATQVDGARIRYIGADDDQ